MTLRLWDIRPHKMVLWENKYNRLISNIALDKYGQLLALCSSDSIFILDAQTGKEAVIPITGHLETVNSVRFSPNNSRYIVSSSDDNNAIIWDLHSRGKKVLWGHVNDVNYASFSNDGNFIVTVSDDCTARIWDAKTGQQVIDPIRHKGPVLYASFSPDGNQLVTASKDNTARIWDVKKRKLLFVLPHQDVVNSADYSPDGKYVVTASDKTVRIWDAQNGKQNGSPLIGHTGLVQVAYFTEDGKKIISSSNCIKMWDVMSRKQIGQQYTSDNPNVLCSFVDNNSKKNIIAGSFDKSIIVWKNPYSYDLIKAMSKRFLKRKLTDYERNEYFLK